MIIPANINNRLDPNQNGSNTGTPSFVGGVWNDYIRPNIGGIVGGLIGGPIGAGVGLLAQRLVDNCMNRSAKGVLPQQSRVDVLYPIESDLVIGNDLTNFITTEFKTSVQKIVNELDTVFNNNNGVNQAVINKTNQTLKDLATLKAYANFIQKNGDSYTNDIVAQHKADLILQSATTVEKMIIKYFNDNQNPYKMVSQPFEASTSSKVAFIRMDWKGKTVMANLSKYILQNQPTQPNETEVSVINTDVTTTAPAVQTNPNESEIVVVEGKKTNWLKTGIGLAAGFAIVKTLIK